MDMYRSCCVIFAVRHVFRSGIASSNDSIVVLFYRSFGALNTCAAPIYCAGTAVRLIVSSGEGQQYRLMIIVGGFFTWWLYGNTKEHCTTKFPMALPTWPGVSLDNSKFLFLIVFTP